MNALEIIIATAITTATGAIVTGTIVAVGKPGSPRPQTPIQYATQTEHSRLELRPIPNIRRLCFMR